MSDLVKRLRQEDGSSYAASLMQEAADRIEELEIECERYDALTDMQQKRIRDLERNKSELLKYIERMDGYWTSIEKKEPSRHEPVVYARPYRRSGEDQWHVGIAYWTVSKRWNPEAQSIKCPNGFTHWMPLPEPPND